MRLRPTESFDPALNHPGSFRRGQNPSTRSCPEKEGSVVPTAFDDFPDRSRDQSIGIDLDYVVFLRELDDLDQSFPCAAARATPSRNGVKVNNFDPGDVVAKDGKIILAE